MAKRTFHVEFDFPELPGGAMYQSANVEASDLGRACDLALREIRKRPKVKGRRITQAKIRAVEISASRVDED